MFQNYGLALKAEGIITVDAKTCVRSAYGRHTAAAICCSHLAFQSAHVKRSQNADGVIANGVACTHGDVDAVGP